jgi:Fe-S-cluster containining protein
MKVTVHWESPEFRIVSIDGQRLLGGCHRCGACCERAGCAHLSFELFNGQRRAVCEIYSHRPVGCALWPDLEDVIPEGCGYAWAKKKGGGKG